MNSKAIAAACRAALTAVVCLSASVTAARAQAVPAPWSARDIGGPALGGRSELSGDFLSVDAAGEDIWGSTDQFHFVYRTVKGDVDVRARIDRVSAAASWSKAGVMIRSSLTKDAAHGYALVSAGKGTAFHRRLSGGGVTASTAGPAAGPAYWVRLVRNGTRVTAYTSSDGIRWTVTGSDTVALSGTAYVGIAVTSRQPLTRTTATVSQVMVAAAGLPAGQVNTDIGQPAIAGNTAFANGKYTVRGAGEDIAGTADQFHFVYQQATGDVDVVARVTSITAAHAWSRAGVMIRESLEPGARHVYSATSSGNGYAFQRRPDPDGTSEHAGAGSGGPPGWVRLVRTGSLLESFRSGDGVTWKKTASDLVIMNETVYVGIAVTSHNVNTATVATVDNFRVVQSAAPGNSPPLVTLTSPATGSAFAAPATIDITAIASDADGSVTGVDFYLDATFLGRDTSAPYSHAAASVQPGTYAVRAVGTDNAGSTTIATVTVVVGSGTGAPRSVAFTASADHDSLVLRYVLDVYASGATPGSSTPIVSSDLGKPAVNAMGEVTVDRSALFEALAPGSYIATVKAVGDAGATRSAAAGFSR